MRKVILVICAVLFVFLTQGQESKESSNKNATQKFNPFKIKVLDQADIFGVDLYWCDWYNKSQSIRTKGFSFGFNINYYYDVAFTRKQNFSLAVGIGYNLFNMHNQGKYTIFDDTLNGTRYTKLEHLSTQELLETKTNRIMMHTIDVPLELRLRFGKGENKFKIYPGIKFGYNFGLAYTRKTETQKTVISNFPDINNFRIAPTLRIGFKDFFLFGSIDLISVFKDNQNTRFTPIRLGISLGG